jgi:hypothetical protein
VRKNERESKNESEAEPRRATLGEGGRATPSSKVYSARQSRLPVSSSTSGVSELTPILIVTVEARSSHCLRVRLSLEGWTAPEGIARRRMAGACAVSLFLCPKRVKALRLGVERASYFRRPAGLGVPHQTSSRVCVVRCEWDRLGLRHAGVLHHGSSTLG